MHIIVETVAPPTNAPSPTAVARQLLAGRRTSRARWIANATAFTYIGGPIRYHLPFENFLVPSRRPNTLIAQAGINGFIADQQPAPGVIRGLVAALWKRFRVRA